MDGLLLKTKMHGFGFQIIYMREVKCCGHLAQNWGSLRGRDTEVRTPSMILGRIVWGDPCISFFAATDPIFRMQKGSGQSIQRTTLRVIKVVNLQATRRQSCRS